MTRGPLRPFGFASLRQPDACGAGASRLCGKQNAYLTGSLQKSRRPQSAQKSRTLLRLCFAKLLVLLVGGPDDFVAGASRAHPTRPLRGGRIARLERKVVIVVLLSLYVIASFSIKEPSQFLYWRKCLAKILRHFIGGLVRRYAHRLRVVTNDIVHERLVHVLAG